MTTPQAFDDLVHSYLDLRWQFDPVQATGAGLSEHDGRLGDFSTESVERSIAALRSISHAIEELSLETTDDELDRTALLNEIRVTVHRFTRERPHVKNPAFWLSHLLQGLYFLLVRDDRPTVHRARAAASRLEAVPRFLEQAKATLQDCPWVFTQTCLGVIDGGLALIRKIGEHLRPEGDQQFDDVRDQAVAALDSFARDLPGMALLPEAGGFAIGQEAFDFRLRVEHALGSSANDLREYGKELVEQVGRALVELAGKIDSGV